MLTRKIVFFFFFYWSCFDAVVVEEEFFQQDALTTFRSDSCQNYWSRERFLNSSSPTCSAKQLSAIFPEKKQVKRAIHSEEIFSQLPSGNIKLMVSNVVDVVFDLKKEPKFVYLDVVKSGSSLIRAALEKFRNQTWKRTPHLKSKRWRSNNLQNDLLADAFVFSVVRNPLSRFPSSVCEGYHQLKTRKGIKMQDFVRATLNKLFRGKRSNEHFDTQMKRIAVTDKFGDPIPLDFIGRLEKKEDLLFIEKKLGLPFGSLRRQARQRHTECGTTERLTKILEKDWFDSILCYTMQDHVCFGYDFPRRRSRSFCSGLGEVLTPELCPHRHHSSF